MLTIIKNKIKKIKDFNLLEWFVFLGFLCCISSFVLIFIFSDDIVKFPPRFDYIGFHKFDFFFSFPIKLLIGSTTLLGINFAYKAYLHNKETFFLLNKPLIYIERIEIQFNKKFTFPFKIWYLIKNDGNLVAKNISINFSIDISPFKDSKKYNNFYLLPNKTHNDILVLNKPLSDKIISEKEVIFNFDILYYSTDDKGYKLKIQYKYVHSQSDIFKINEQLDDV